jgi:hypothetical protein
MLTTKFRVWLQDARIPPVWTGVKLVSGPQYVKANYLDVTVQGNGSDRCVVSSGHRILSGVPTKIAKSQLVRALRQLHPILKQVKAVGEELETAHPLKQFPSAPVQLKCSYDRKVLLLRVGRYLGLLRGSWRRNKEPLQST